MDRSSLEDIHRELQKRKKQKEIIERESRFLEEQLKAAKLQRSLSTQGSSSQQARYAKFTGARRQSAASMTRNAQRSPTSPMMNRSFTVQPTPSTIDMSPENSITPMPSIHEFNGISTGMMDRLSQDEPANVFLLRTSCSDEKEYPAPDCGSTPWEFLSSYGAEDDLASAPTNFPPYHAPTTTAPPSLVSGGESIATPMSRGSSSVGGSYLRPQELSRSDSNLSPSLERWPSHEMYGITNDQQTQNPGKNLLVGNDMLAGMGGSFASPSESVPMSRSISNLSSSSTRSTASKQGERAKEAHERHILNSLRNQIAPKPCGESDASDSSSSPSSKKDGKIPLAKKEYRRPQHDRVMCDRCNDKPEGFRGQHELSRHVAAKHSEVVTKWQVRDPRKVGIQTSLEPVTPLEKCKACQAHKMYGAYYNVAAHMRRSHFRHKSRKQGKKNSLQAHPEKLGSEDPPMSELKKWMIQVQVRAEGVALGDEFEPEDDEVDFDYNMNISPYQSIPDMPLSPDTSTSISSASPYLPHDLGFGDMLDAAYNSQLTPNSTAMDYAAALAEDFMMSQAST